MARPFLLISAPAKINLYLGVHPGKEEDGYHRVDTVMTTIDLTDTVEIAPADELFVRVTPAQDFPMEQNTAYRAARAMGDAFGRQANFTILIDKHIPVRAGLGGPSTDAAAVILGIAHLWDLDPLDPRIEQVAQGIGADVPFFLHGSIAWLAQRGDTLQELFAPLTATPVALVRPPGEAGVTSQEAYAAFDKNPTAPADLGQMLQALRAHDEASIMQAVANNLAPAAAEVLPSIAQVLSWMRAQPGVRAADVCGSGSTVFAICKTQRDAEAMVSAAQNEHGWWAKVAKMEKTGPVILHG
ncbi:4-(cytidine 5'-diphospho)-2-C-methyl-D-erythritol kinase [Collinsella sp. AGMB00827]|uniref:4-diphosphocytidyl-2-C-methyl-D-erythritol kinase n=1 Tax=Collinsella ureilytica TaxID=2869515 RepID=A0ABS7MJ83_9ACTN|nr:4-(cytidine 5'-diphospho)-2-C-methyl-D-erythritol kinase [Collinsella urealyticum]MBY4797433.1 4-(cytidine 5'-diphospho)-2-C-methyl-D-erythritol kinase [Collinsella urealyticum]